MSFGLEVLNVFMFSTLFLTIFFFSQVYTYNVGVVIYIIVFVTDEKKKKQPDIDRSIDRSGSEVQRGHRPVYRSVQPPITRGGSAPFRDVFAGGPVAGHNRCQKAMLGELRLVMMWG